MKEYKVIQPKLGMRNRFQKMEDLLNQYAREGWTVKDIAQGWVSVVLERDNVGILISVSLIFFFKLTTRIDEKGIHYQFFPFHFKFKLISWNEISKVFVRTYDPIGEYGGWGLKGGWSKSKGKAINVSGDIGIQLELKTGKKLLIGTQKENDAKSVLETYNSKINES